MISERIKRVLKNRGISLEEAGKKLGVSKQRVSWVLINRSDDEWSEKEKVWWSERLKIDKQMFNGVEK